MFHVPLIIVPCMFHVPPCTMFHVGSMYVFQPGDEIVRAVPLAGVQL